jgi:hypothetical protein
VINKNAICKKKKACLICSNIYVSCICILHDCSSYIRQKNKIKGKHYQTNIKERKGKSAVPYVMDFLNNEKALKRKKEKLKKPNIGGPCGRNSMYCVMES